MKNSYKAILLAALGLSAVSAAQAQEMLLGMTDTSGNASAHNDYVIDLGAYTQFTATATLGGSINSGTVNTAYGSVDPNYLNDVAVGAVTGNNSPKFIYQTGSFVSPLTATEIGSAGSLVSAVAVGEYASSSSSGWSANVETDSSNVGANNGTSGSISGDTGLLMHNLSSGIVTETLFSGTVSGLSTVHESTLGTLTVNLNNDTWSFQGANASVPEPATYGLLAGAGLLVIGLRNQFTRKKA